MLCQKSLQKFCNKAPIILDKSYGIKEDPYNSIDESLLNKRAELVTVSYTHLTLPTTPYV